eukprot:CAMPEP_0115282598 /NCGR_PEP_ID=MMETSP0270-20121206/59929_1 /TAXON_ID=71861 /ORGANISM="Scrippsiella trochoidea, Strain CCMP3099" /LENGTH=81 /DNA_ID=CAMNT_0002699457 /DNA_START=429 /DNA_END=674 /DNA_ORIENTATION=-
MVMKTKELRGLSINCVHAFPAAWQQSLTGVQFMFPQHFPTSVQALPGKAQTCLQPMLPQHCPIAPHAWPGKEQTDLQPLKT